MRSLVFVPLLLLALRQPPAIAPAVAAAAESVAAKSVMERRPRPVETVVPNDNRRPAGTVRSGVLRLRLVARLAKWRPGQSVDSTVTVMTFAEEGRAPRMQRANRGHRIHGVRQHLRHGLGAHARCTVVDALPHDPAHHTVSRATRKCARARPARCSTAPPRGHGRPGTRCHDYGARYHDANPASTPNAPPSRLRTAGPSRQWNFAWATPIGCDWPISTRREPPR